MTTEATIANPDFQKRFIITDSLLRDSAQFAASAKYKSCARRDSKTVSGLSASCADSLQQLRLTSSNKSEEPTRKRLQIRKNQSGLCFFRIVKKTRPSLKLSRNRPKQK
jgi:hypothetical protein